MQKYKVLKEFVDGPEEAQVTYEVGAVVEFDAESDITLARLAEGEIEDFIEEGPKDEATVNASSAQDGGADSASSSSADILPPIEQGAAGDTEPRKRYRGQVVLSEEDRTVESQTFKHILCADGVQYDLTDAEYAAEVHVSYPPTA